MFPAVFNEVMDLKKKNEHLADLAFGIGHLNGKFMVYLVSVGLVTIPDRFENKKQRQWQ